jgi:hypothetical protein
MSDGNWTFGKSIQKMLRQPSFLLVAGILLLSAISLNAATQYLQLYFKKLPVELSHDLSTIPSKLGHWVQVSRDEKLGEDMEHVLGATHYLYRDYVDSSKVPAAVIEKFEGKSFGERKAMAAYVQQNYPDAVINLGVTYYTGMVDTVAHIPDRCYIADGYVPTEYQSLNWSAFDDRAGRSDDGDVRYINFEDQIAARQAAPKNVAYFFHANGKYTSDPIHVRVLLQDLFQPYAYYTKIELMTVMPDKEKSTVIMNDFLKSALPQIESCLPDWKAVTALKK